MEEDWILDRAELRRLMAEHPEWTGAAYAEEVGRSHKWVQKWQARLADTALDDEQVLHSQSRARKTVPESYQPQGIERILALRDAPPPATPRKIGPRTILYYLQQDEELAAAGYRLPKSPTTIWKILDAHQRILRPKRVEHVPFERPEPMDVWEIDFTDVKGAQASHDHKQQHQVEAFAVVDRGSSMLVDLQVSDRYEARQALMAIASTLIECGRPDTIVLDRDPRFIGSWSAQDFPSAFMRFLMNLGINLDICPPQRPDHKPFVERYFRTLNQEVVQVHLPKQVAQCQSIFETHHYIYNHERPHQADVCHNQPPAVAFPSLPKRPSIPDTVDPDRWLTRYHGRHYQRRVTHNGSFQVDKHRYYVKRVFVGRYVVCRLDAHRQVFDVFAERQLLKSIPIKGLYQQTLSFEDYLQFSLEDAEAEQQRLARLRQRRVS